MPKHVNTFIGGLDRDTAPTKYSNTHYYNAKNFSMVVAEDLSSATLTNTKGVTTKFKCLDQQVVGVCEVDSSLLIFTKGTSVGYTTYGYIYKILFTSLDSNYDVVDLSYQSQYLLLYQSNFNFGDRLDIVVREETVNIKKIYWVDGINPLRFCNISLGPSVLATYALNQFEIIQNVTFTTPLYSKLISGNLTCGMYQYAYCLYNQNSSQTAYSTPSQFIQISETGLVPYTTDFMGGNIGTKSNNGVQILINDSNTNFDFIRVVSLFYSTPSSVPEVTIIYEGARTSSVTITHTGNELLGTLTAEEVALESTILTPNTIASKYNYLFVGNIDEGNFDIDFDASTYRFNSSKVARLYINTSDYSNPSTYVEIGAGVSPLAPSVVTGVIQYITSTTAKCVGSSTNEYHSEPVIDRGICWSTSPNPTIADAHTHNALGLSAFDAQLTGLTPNTLYYVRAYAVTGISTYYDLAHETSFTTTVAGLATVTTNLHSIQLSPSGNIKTGGNVVSEGDSSVTVRGVCLTTTKGRIPDINDEVVTAATGGIGSYSCTYFDGILGSYYAYRAFATNSAGTAYGELGELNNLE